MVKYIIEIFPFYFLMIFLTFCFSHQILELQVSWVDLWSDMVPTWLDLTQSIFEDSWIALSLKIGPDLKIQVRSGSSIFHLIEH